jgi:hypothetical protein
MALVYIYVERTVVDAEVVGLLPPWTRSFADKHSQIE